MFNCDWIKRVGKDELFIFGGPMRPKPQTLILEQIRQWNILHPNDKIKFIPMQSSKVKFTTTDKVVIESEGTKLISFKKHERPALELVDFPKKVLLKPRLTYLGILP